MAFSPPPGYDDFLDDAERTPVPDPQYEELDVPGVGVVRARRPLPNSAPALAMAANSRIKDVAKLDYLALFARNHLAPGELERILIAQMTEDMPSDAVMVIARSIACWGTARPTRRSSRSR